MLIQLLLLVVVILTGNRSMNVSDLSLHRPHSGQSVNRLGRPRMTTPAARLADRSVLSVLPAIKRRFLG